MQTKSSDRLDRLDALATRMDRASRFPFTRIRFGWDGILGLVPGVGDTLTMAPAIYIVQQAHDMGASKPVLVRMAANIGIDWLIGFVPLVGDSHSGSGLKCRDLQTLFGNRSKHM